MPNAAPLWERWPALTAVPPALAWLSMRADLGLAHRSTDAYARGLSEYLAFCAAAAADPLTARREHVARFVRHLTERPSRHAGADAAAPSSARPRLSNATVQQRLTAVRLFYDYLVEEGLRDTNPVGRGRYVPCARVGGSRRGLVPRQTRLPWIPDEADWHAILDAARREPIRNRTMLALGYDAGLRREELCSLRTDDLDPEYRLLRVRAETTKSRRERVVPYSAVSGELLRAYLGHRAGISRARGLLFLSESRRNHAAPLTPWTWSKVVRRIALAAAVPRFGTDTLRHPARPTSPARAGSCTPSRPSLGIATRRRRFSTFTSPACDAGKLAHGMAQIHDWRIADAGRGRAGGMCMSMPPPLLEVVPFDRAPVLSRGEREALAALGWQLRRRRGHDAARPEWGAIGRLLAPLDAARLALRDRRDTPLHRRSSKDAVGLVLRRAGARRRAPLTGGGPRRYGCG